MHFVRTNAFLRALAPEPLSTFFHLGRAYAEGLLGRRDIPAGGASTTPDRSEREPDLLAADPEISLAAAAAF